MNVERVASGDDIRDWLYGNTIGYRNFFGIEYIVGDQYDSCTLNREKHLSDCIYWEQAEIFRVLFETVMGISVLRNQARTYSGETIQVACCLPPEFDDSEHWDIMKEFEGHHMFDLYVPQEKEWIHFDFTISSIITEPKDFVYSLPGIYREKPEYSDLFKSCPFMFGAELALYLHINDHKS